MLFSGSLATYVSTGCIVYFHVGGYHAVPFDAATLMVTGAARPVLEDARPLDPLGSSENYVDVARDGRLVYVPGGAPRSAPYSHLAWIDRHGRVERLPFDDTLGHAELSPDQRHVAVTRFAAGDVQIWIYDLERGTRDQLTRDGSNFDPRWSPAGDKVAFTSLLRGSFDLRWSPPDGSRPPENLLATDQDESRWDWLPDGRSGVFEAWEPGGGEDIQTMPVGEPGKRRTLAGTPLDESEPQVSSDGQWLAWSAVGTVYVAHYPDMTHRVQVAIGASTPRWAHRSHELFFEKDADARGAMAGRAIGLHDRGPDPALRDPPRTKPSQVLHLGRRHTLSHPRERYGQGITGGDPGDRRRLERAGGAGKRRVPAVIVSPTAAITLGPRSRPWPPASTSIPCAPAAGRR